jgi:uncharacterized flavoprotein (TIGR03862 family)
MAAETLVEGGARVELYDAKPTVGRKLLVAGKGGLNLTHSEPLEQFLARYGARRPQFEIFLRAFGPDRLRAWAAELGIQTFTGSSDRVFPVGMKSTPLLRAWLARLRASGVSFHPRHRWLGWDAAGALRFETPSGEIAVPAEALVLALGGASWPVTGSDGAWVALLEQRGVAVAPLKPANCGFDVAWSGHFRTRFAGHALKAVVLSFNDGQEAFRQRGEFIITETGVEGSLIYACSRLMREQIEADGQARIHLDLAPGYALERLVERLSRPQGARSLASHLERTVKLRGVKAGLVWEFVPKEVRRDPARLAAAIKDLPVPLLRPRPIEEAISSAGGVPFEVLDERLMLKVLPGVFCAGEMLDWEAPTGGYLLTGCLATGKAAAAGVLEYLAGDGQL